MRTSSNCFDIQHAYRLLDELTCILTNVPKIVDEQKCPLFSRNSTSVSKDVKIIPEKIDLTLPKGSLGISFEGCPPWVTKIDETSPLMKHGIIAGMKVDTLTIDSVTYYEMDTVELTSHLKEHENSDRRQIRFLAPHYDLTPPPIPQYVFIKQIPNSLDVTLPTGRIGVWFIGESPIVVKAVRKDSALKDALPEGMGVNTLTVGNIVYKGLNLDQLASILMKTSDKLDRVLNVIKPELYGDELDIILQHDLNTPT